jgi:hypothetical protein
MTDEKITCPSCEHENAPGARFCEQCGADLTAPPEAAEPEATELICANCGEANALEARFCKACGEALAAEEAAAKAGKKPKAKPAKGEKKRLPGWARILITTLVVAVVGAVLGLGFAYVSPFIDTYLTHSPARMERAGLLAQEFVDRAYPAFADAEHTISVDTDTVPVVYVVDFYAQDGEKSLALRILVDKYLTRARALEYLEIDAPEPYDSTMTVDVGDGEQVQPVPSGGLEDLLIDPRIVRYDDFTSLDESRWSINDGGDLNGEGQIELTGESPFATQFFSRFDFTGGEGFIFSLRYSSDAAFEITLDSGEWETDSFYRAGVYRIGWEISTNIWQRGERIDERTLSSLPIGAGRWYGVLGAIDGDGTLMIAVWDLENPSLAIAFEKEFGEEAAGLAWTMHVAADSGTVTVDDYYELRFDGFQ